MILGRLLTRGRAGRPSGPGPARAGRTGRRRGRGRGDLVRPLQRAPGDRRPPGAGRPDVERAGLAVAHGRAAPPAPGPDGARPAARRRRGADLARPLRPPRQGDGHDPRRARRRPVRRPARDRRSPAAVGGARGPHRGAGLGASDPRRRPHADLRGVQALLGPPHRPQHHPVVGVGGDGPDAPGLLRRRHRLHGRVRPHGRRAGPVRPDAVADRGLRRPLARRAHDPRGSGARAPRPPRRTARARALGDFRPRIPRLGRTRCGGCCRRPRDADVRIALPRPGQRIDARDPGRQVDWWSRLG